MAKEEREIDDANISVGIASFQLLGKPWYIEKVTHEMRAWFAAWCACQAEQELEDRHTGGYITDEQYQEKQEKLEIQIAGGLFKWTMFFQSDASLMRLRTLDGQVEMTRLRMRNVNKHPPGTEKIQELWLAGAKKIVNACKRAEGVLPNEESPETEEAPGETKNESELSQPTSPGKELTKA